MKRWNERDAPTWFTEFSSDWSGEGPKTLVRLGQAVVPEAIRELHNRLVAIAQQRRVVRGRKIRVDTTGGGKQHSLSDRQQPAE